MKRIEAVDKLIERHELLSKQYEELSLTHSKTVKDLKSYKYELTKPGFRTKGWVRCSEPKRTEPYIVQPGNTWDGPRNF